jgi:rhamnosyl/mannosyltransferase
LAKVSAARGSAMGETKASADDLIAMRDAEQVRRHERWGKDTRVKVLQVNKLYLPTIGGIETTVKNIAEGLNDRTNMTVLVCQSKGKAVEEVINGIRIFRAKCNGIVKSMPVSLDFFLKFYKLSRQTDIIQLHAPFPLADLTLWLFRNKSKKVVLWWHSDIIRQRIFLKLVTPFILHTLKRVDAIVVATEGNIESSNFLPRFRDKIRIVPFGLNFSEYDIPLIENYLQDKLNNKNSVKLLFVGRLVYYKGMDVLIKAMENVHNTELFIVGNGDLENMLKSDVSNLNIESKVHFIPSLPRNELLSAFADCDVFAFPSVANSEAFGLVQLEAMYYGKPVINTNLPTGVPYVSIDGETGLTVEAGNVKALTTAINKLATDGELRKTLGQNARKRAEEHFSRQVMTDGLYAIYEELVAK